MMGNMMKFDAEQMMNRMISHTFRPVDNIVWSMTSGNSAVVRSDKSILSFKEKNGEYAISEQLFDMFGMPIPAFAQQMALSQIQRGDIIVQNDGSNAWALGPEGNSLKILKTDGQVTTIVPTVLEGGFANTESTTFMVVRSLMNIMGGETNLGSFRNSLMPMLMISKMTGKNFDFKEIMPFLLMSGGTFNFGGEGMGGMMGMFMMSTIMGGKSPF